MRSIAATSGHLTKISHSKASETGQVGQRRAVDVTQQLQTEFPEMVLKYTESFFFQLTLSVI